MLEFDHTPHKYDSTLSLSHTGKSLDSPKFSCYLSKPNTKFKSFTYVCFLIYLPHFWNISAVAHHMTLRYRKWFQYVFKSMICRYILVFLESSKTNGDNSPIPAEDTCIGTHDFLTHNIVLWSVLNEGNPEKDDLYPRANRIDLSHHFRDLLNC